MENYKMGVDTSKGYANFTILELTKAVVEPDFQLDDTYEGHCKLYEILEDFFQKHPGCTLDVGIESTGGYENNWLHFLMKCSSIFNIRVARLNPLGVSKQKEASLERNKTDKISAKTIAEYLINHSEKVTYQKTDPLAPLKSQWKFIELLKKQQVQLLNTLEKNLYGANTETLIYCKHGVPNWLLTLVKQFPTAQLLAQATVEQVAQIRYVSLNRAKKLVTSAQNSVASSSDEVTAERIRKLAQDILDKKKDIDKQKKLFEKDAKRLPRQIQLLKSLKGIGTYSAVGLLVLIGNINDFSSAKKLACFFGLHPVYKQSGDGTWAFRMSKQGNRAARQILYMVTLAALRLNPFVKELFIKQRQKGMKAKAAMGVCMHKILRIIYGMLKNDTEFDPEIDKQNREKHPVSFKKANKDDSRRHQTHDSFAPVSRRQAKKRKEQEQEKKQNNIHDKIISNVEFGLN
jgi:transposase